MHRILLLKDLLLVKLLVFTLLGSLQLILPLVIIWLWSVVILIVHRCLLLEIVVILSVALLVFSGPSLHIILLLALLWLDSRLPLSVELLVA